MKNLRDVFLVAALTTAGVSSSAQEFDYQQYIGNDFTIIEPVDYFSNLSDISLNPNWPDFIAKHDNPNITFVSILAKKNDSNELVQCNFLKIKTGNNQDFSALRNAGYDIRVSSPVLADMLRPAPNMNELDFFSFGSCMPYESPINWQGFTEDPYLNMPTEPFAIEFVTPEKFGENRRKIALRETFDYLFDPKRERNMLSSSDQTYSLFEQKPCLNSGYRPVVEYNPPAKPDQIELRDCEDNHLKPLHP
jgi:hypothetical protein